jgi:hypothetical protein
MLKKCLIALVLVALSSAPVFAHPTWEYGVTTSVSWEWATRPGPSICVQMKVVMWADLYKTGCLILKQVDGNNFAGCVDVKLCVNFPGIDIGVQYIPEKDITTAKDNKGYKISIEEKGDAPDFSDWAVKPSAKFHTEEVHLSNDLMILEICMLVKDVDPQALPYTNMSLVQVGEILTTLTPTLAPPGQPANGIIDTDFFPSVIP